MTMSFSKAVKGCWGALMLLGCAAFCGESYNFYFFSDPHFGAADSFAVNPKTGKLRTKKDPHRMETMMQVYEAMFKDMAAHFDDKTAFVIEGGDLIEGWAKNGVIHAQELQKALAMMEKYLPRPIFGVNGNHDSNGAEGKVAFQQVMIPFLRKTSGQKDLKNDDFVIRKGEDLFIFTDCYDSAKGKNKLSFALKTLRGLDWKPRYVFLTLHANVMQFPKGETLELMCEMAKHNGIILCGHTHQTLLLTAKRPEGTVSQFSIGTLLVPPLKKSRYTQIVETVPGYLPMLEKSCRKYKTLEAVQKELIPYLTQVWYGKGSGYARIEVGDAGIVLKIQSADLSQKPIPVKIQGR